MQTLTFIIKQNTILTLTTQHLTYKQLPLTHINTYNKQQQYVNLKSINNLQLTNNHITTLNIYKQLTNLYKIN